MMMQRNPTQVPAAVRIGRCPLSGQAIVSDVSTSFSQLIQL